MKGNQGLRNASLVDHASAGTIDRGVTREDVKAARKSSGVTLDSVMGCEGFGEGDVGAIMQKIVY